MCSVKCLRRVLLWCLLSNWISGKDLVASTVASSLCLPSGLNPEFRKNLSKAGESYPVGVVLADWSSAHVTSAVFEILIEEVLGYNIYVDPRSPASTLDGIYALIGCTTFMNAVDRGCTDRNAKLHMMSESCQAKVVTRKSTHVLSHHPEVRWVGPNPRQLYNQG